MQVGLIKSRSGFSLVELLIFAGLLAFLSMLLLQMSELQQKVINTTEAGFETLSLVNDVGELLSHPPACEKTFHLQKIDKGEAASIYRAYLNNLGVWQLTEVYKLNEPISKILRLKSIKLQGSIPSDGSANVVLEITHLKPVLGPAVVSRTVRLIRVVVDTANQVVGCQAEGIQPAPGLSVLDVCNSIEHGVWDTVSGKCKIVH